MTEETKIQTPTGFQCNPRAAQGMEQLTPREREILVLLAQGGYYREIGGSLGISTFTVRAHLHSIYKKLGVNSRGRAVAEFHKLNRVRLNQRSNGTKEISNESRNTSTHFMQPT